MRNNPITQEKELVKDFGSLATTYQQISVMRMQQIREEVLQTRNFLDGLDIIFGNVKYSYKNQLEQMAKKQKKTTVSAFPKNGKDMVVLLSANTKLYGDIIPKTFFTFLEEAKKTTGDIMIIGMVGKELFEESGIRKNYAYIDFPDENASLDLLKNLTYQLMPYEKVQIFYGKFENVMVQNPSSTNLTGEETIPTEQDPSKPVLRFAFEPTLETILSFFETQIFSSLFKQSIHENALARYGSRITAMEDALGNIYKKIHSLTSDERRFKSREENKKRLESLTGIHFGLGKEIK